MMAAISTVILAGGPGTRIGGGKALQLLQGRPLIDWVWHAVRPQSAEVMISANESAQAYAQYGCRVIADRIAVQAGPLAGLQAALVQAKYAWVASVPCDTPFLPRDLTVHLLAAMRGSDAEAAVAVAGGRRQAAVALYRRGVLHKLNAYLADGGRKVAAWQDSLQLAEVPFADAAAFTNLNSARELALANRVLHNGGTCEDIRRAIT